ncbi:MAG: alpha/beta fold hydrolase [bacterium]
MDEQLSGVTAVDREVELGDVRLRYVEAGRGPLVLLLHGMPQFWYAWRRQIPVLADAGFRVVAPDLRGFNLSGKPKGISPYRLDVVAEDVARLIPALGAERATIVGHDMGGEVAWPFAAAHPAMVERLVILDAPHPQRLASALKTKAQRQRSSYMYFFRLPWLPEWLIRRNHFAAYTQMFRTNPIQPGAISDEDIRRYVESWSVPGALTASINYYRAGMSTKSTGQLPPITAPVMVLWGDDDHYLPPDLAAPDPALVPNARVEIIRSAVTGSRRTSPDRVNELLLGFLKAA